MSDLVERAARALRESAGEPAHEESTRARILSTVGRRTRRRRSLTIGVAGLVLVALVPVARARGSIAEAWRELLAEVRGERTGEAIGREAIVAAPSQAPPVVPPVVPTAVPTVVPMVVAIPAPVVPAVVAPRPVRAQVRKAEIRLPDPSEGLYQEAHRLHFVERDPERALAAWDRYLAAAPRSRFVPEASYNRALALLRLGRRAEATVALEGFSQAPVGSYRQREAAALLEALAIP